MMDDLTVEAAAMIVRHARERHARSVEAKDAADEELKSAVRALELAEIDLDAAVEAFVSRPAASDGVPAA
jgi:hypothetical protein